MTAEVVILSRSGAALAADSAVTISNTSSAKVYNTVNKLFTLSKYHPIGIMIYGNSEYMGVPWETIIKMYRDKLGRSGFDTVDQYATDLLKFLEARFTPSDYDKAVRVGRIWAAYFEFLNKNARTSLLAASAKKQLLPAEAKSIFLRVLKDQATDLRNLHTFKGLEKLDTSEVTRTFSKEFEQTTRMIFRGRPFTPAIMRALRECAGLCLIKADFRWSMSGVVIAGFGHTEIFPSMAHIESAGIVLNVHKFVKHETQTITTEEDNSGYIGAFAQNEMVVRFMEGVDNNYSEYIENGARQLISRISDELIHKYW